MNILIFTPDSQEARRYQELCAEALPAATINAASSAEEAEPFVGEAEILVGWKFPESIFGKARSLRWIHKFGAGVDDVAFRNDLPTDIMLTRNEGAALAPRMVEYVVAAIFALSQRLHLCIRNQQRRDWKPLRTELTTGKVVGVAGLGDIGSLVARRMTENGMRVVGWRRSAARDVPLVDHVYCGNEEFGDFLSVSDFVVSVLPSTPETRHLFNADTFAKMKRDACLINIGRGTSVDEPALVQALKTDAIGGAVLDVFEKEPLAPDSELWDLENLIITPHMSGPIIPEDAVPVFLENVRRFEAGEKLLKLIDRTRGY